MQNRLLIILACGILMADGALGAISLPVIGQRGKVFSLTEVGARVGSTIRIENDDNIVHTLQISTPDGESRNLGMQKPGEFTDILVDKAGDYMARCGIHPKMKLVIKAY